MIQRALMFTLILGSAAALCSCSCLPAVLPQPGNPLPSWSEGPAKAAILEFVNLVTDPAQPDFIPEPERVAVFDNDGTLWAEQPLYFQLAFALDRIKALAPSHPKWKTEQPFKAVIEDDRTFLSKLGEKELLEIVMASHSGMTTEEFDQDVRDWLAVARHPRFDRPYTELVYQPQLELLAFLRANGFKTFIVSGGGIDFMRPFTEDVYGIPPEQVVGSTIATGFEMRDGSPVLVHLPELDFVNDKEGKPVAIQRFIGRRPVLAFGNSDGDLQMLQWTAAGAGASLPLLVHHDDAEREWAYDRESHIGRLDKALDEAREGGWTVVSMKTDWKRVF